MEPPYVSGVPSAGVRKAFGDVVALDGVDLRVAGGRAGRGRRAERVREVDAAVELVCGLEAPDAGHGRRAAGGADAAARRAAAVAVARSTTRRWRGAWRASRAPRRGPRRTRTSRAFGLDGLRAARARRR